MNACQTILILLIAGIAGVGSVLDEGQMHRPLVVCPLIGLVLGDLKTGIVLGGQLEMMALGWMNVGLSISPDTALSAVITTLVVITTHASIGDGIALAVPLAAAGQVLTIFVRTLTVFLVHQADAFAKKGQYHLIETMHVLAMIIQALRVMVPTAGVMILNMRTVEGYIDNIPSVISDGLQIGGGIIVVVGYAMVINMMDIPDLKPFFYLGFLFAAFTNFNLVGFGGLGLILAILYLQLEYRSPQKLKAQDFSAGEDDNDDLDN
ncbi:PTS mannose/fructose/sorbose transporter subunit IIC [Liquorilactobacillus vini]|uniref:PTS mannose/fructose/sorbose transporter subunit IIC n=1 Tax=Liquorilactobacillus vini TaxID=238015 RepID=UPI0002D79AF5|nr:PTS mannose/fructose/sorbose transporter subunit IIC [Liquorilactobacillus vini]